MNWDVIQDYVIHQETYKAILKGLMPHGIQKEIAKKAGITAVYLSNLLQPEHPPPSSEIVERIIKSLPLEPIQRFELRKHIELSKQKRRNYQSEIADSDSLSEIAELLGSYRERLTFGMEGFSSNISYRLLRGVGTKILKQKIPKTETEYLSFIQIALILHDVYCVLNFQGQALHLAKYINSFIEELAFELWDGERLAYFGVNSIYAEAISYHNLNLPTEAYWACDRAELKLKDKNLNPVAARFWGTHICLEKIRTISQKPRFAVSDIEGFERQIRNMLNQNNDPLNPLNNLILNRALIEAYLQHGTLRSLKKARRLAQNVDIERLNDIPYIGPLHKVIFIKTYSRLQATMNNQELSNYWLGVALDIARQNNLFHQIRQIKKTYSMFGG